MCCDDVLTVGHLHPPLPPSLFVVLVVGGTGVGAIQVFEEDHLLFEAAAAKHALRPSAVADPGAVGQTGADAAQPTKVVQTGRGPSPDQLDGGGGVLTDKTLKKNHRNNTVTILGLFLLLQHVSFQFQV